MKFDPQSIVMDLDAFKVRLALPFAARNDVRYYLNGLHIVQEPAGVSVQASNGHVALMVPDDGGTTDVSRIILLSPAAKAYLKEPNRVRCTSDGTVFISDKSGVVLHIEPDGIINATYPDLSKSIGNLADYKPGLSKAFDADYIGLVYTAAKVADPAYRRLMFYTREGEGAPILFAMKDAIGALMPLRVDFPALDKMLPKSLQKAA